MELQKQVPSIGSDHNLHLSARFLLDRRYTGGRKHITQECYQKLNASMRHPRCRAFIMLVKYLRKLDQDLLPSRRRSRSVQLSGSRRMNTKERKGLCCTRLKSYVLPKLKSCILSIQQEKLLVKLRTHLIAVLSMHVC